MGEGARQLAELVAAELSRPAPSGAALLAGAIRERHRAATASVVFYGSCLRRATTEGVLDFYALVDSYRAAYASRALALANAWLPPNVFYLEADAGPERLRAKYAVVSQQDFARGAEGHGLRTGIWARFCQPALAVWVRDARAREALVDAVVRAHLTAVARALPLLRPGERVPWEAFWQRLFRETYSGEMRPEADASVEKLYAAAPDRYDRAGAAALRELAAQPATALRVELDEGGFRAWPAPERRARLGRGLARPLAKAAYAAQLLKTAFTFGDWLPYALWKLERHTGRRIEPTPRQRRHPLVFGWPILWQVLRRRELR
jgi:hypothetical protein